MFGNTKSRAINIVIIVIALVFVLYILSRLLTPTYGNPLPTECKSQFNYVCQSPSLSLNKSNAIFNVLLAQVTNTTWNATNFLWVPNGQQMPNSEVVCLSTINSIYGGISCGHPNNIELQSGTPIIVNFTFNSNSILGGATYYGQIWAEYSEVNGTRRFVQLTSEVKLKAYI